MSAESTGPGRQVGPEIGRPRLLQRVHEAIRVRHYCRRTEEAYVHWIKRLIFFFHGKRHPKTMGETAAGGDHGHPAADREPAVRRRAAGDGGTAVASERYGRLA